MTANPQYIAEAKSLIGKRAWLTGGGQFANHVILCDVKDVRENGQAVVDSGPSGRIFEPFLESWRLQEINPKVLSQLVDIPNGGYTIGFTREGIMPLQSDHGDFYKQITVS